MYFLFRDTVNILDFGQFRVHITRSQFWLLLCFAYWFGMLNSQLTVPQNGTVFEMGGFKEVAGEKKKS